MAIRVAINGFGRIGRTFFRAAKLRKSDIEFVAINDRADAFSLSTVLKYDSIHGIYDGEISYDEENIIVDGTKIPVYSLKEEDGHLPWGELGVDVVIESTGITRSRDFLNIHIDSGANKVLLTTPCADPVDATVVYGVNHDILTGEEKIILNASGTTNSAAVLLKVMEDSFVIKEGFITTVHAYTLDQSLLDYPHEDMRRARSAALSIIPTTTWAVQTVEQIIPRLRGKLDGIAYRVPVPAGSIVDLSLDLATDVTVDDIHDVMKSAATGYLKDVLKYEESPLVSADIVGDISSAIYDAPLTKVLKPDFVKIIGWFDNEAGYCNRVVDLINLLSS
ncbi:MAG: aldehyde dehydrogenase [Candidatus Marinimicrobia bacterium]|nr:aldehyde dehydrogenase [Candidatus Neomarinimicrobiota bacterium]